MFTRQHYKAIAKIVIDSVIVGYSGEMNDRVIHIVSLTTRLADYFEQDNPRFDRQKFLDACGLNT